MLTDFFCLIGTHFDASEAKELWPATLGQMQNWAVGSPYGYSPSTNTEKWRPCEALVRIGCKEMSHLSERVFTIFDSMEKQDVALWLGILCQNFAETLSLNIELERALHSDASREINEEAVLEESKSMDSDKSIETAYGAGTIVGTRIDRHGDEAIELMIVKLESGATLFSPAQGNARGNERVNKVETALKKSPEGKTHFTSLFIHARFTSSPIARTFKNRR